MMARGGSLRHGPPTRGFPACLHVQNLVGLWNEELAHCMDTLAERLRRRPAKPMGSPRVGSNPTGVVLIDVGAFPSFLTYGGVSMVPSIVLLPQPLPTYLLPTPPAHFRCTFLCVKGHLACSTSCYPICFVILYLIFYVMSGLLCQTIVHYALDPCRLGRRLGCYLFPLLFVRIAIRFICKSLVCYSSQPVQLCLTYVFGNIRSCLIW